MMGNCGHCKIKLQTCIYAVRSPPKENSRSPMYMAMCNAKGYPDVFSRANGYKRQVGTHAHGSSVIKVCRHIRFTRISADDTRSPTARHFQTRGIHTSIGVHLIQRNRVEPNGDETTPTEFGIQCKHETHRQLASESLLLPERGIEKKCAGCGVVMHISQVYEEVRFH